METLVTGSIVLMAALVQGLTGFGFALVSVPVLMLVQEPKSVVVTVLLLSTVMNCVMLIQSWRHLTLREALPLTIGSVLGVPIGSYLLVMMSPSTLKLMVAILALLFCVPLLLGYSRGFRHPVAASLVVGGVSGALHSSTGMGGPPVVLFMNNQGIPKQRFRSILVIRSLATSSFSVIALVPSGLLTPEIGNRVLLVIPLLLLGWAVGSRLLRVVRQELFRKVTIAVIVATAVSGIVSVLM